MAEVTVVVCAMPHVTASTDIDVPRDELWDFVNDFDRMTDWMTFEERDGGTRFTQELEFRALPAVRPLGWLLEKLFIERAMRSGLQETQRNLKRLAETELSGREA